MPITSSAKKALRVGARKKLVNDRIKKTVKESIKKTEKLIKAKNQAESVKSLSEAYAAIDKAAKRGVIKFGTASRRKSRLARALAKG